MGGIGTTKVLVEGFGWVYIVLVLDWYTKKIAGYQADLRCTAQQWLEATDRAVNTQFPSGVRGHHLSLLSDNGCQPTSAALLAACRALQIHQAFTGDNNPKGNADTERFMRAMEEESLWLREWTCPFELITALDLWITTDNDQYLHSALGY
jgi:putative transposase